MEEHRRRLGLLCTVGGRKFSSLSKSSRFPVAKYATEVRACFGLCVEDDDEDRCPGDMCYFCHGLVLRYRESSEEGRSFAFSGGGCGFVMPFWKEHTADGVCDFLLWSSFFFLHVIVTRAVSMVSNHCQQYCHVKCVCMLHRTQPCSAVFRSVAMDLLRTSYCLMYGFHTME